MKNKPLVSVLVHTKNSERTIKSHLESISNQSYTNLEIIMVDNNSSDLTLKIAEKLTDGKIFKKENIYTFGPERSAQRNFAARKARGEYFIVPDSDMLLTRNVVGECVEKVVLDPQIKAVVIPEKSVGSGFWSACKALERSCYLKDKTIEAARFFDKNIFWEMGGYDEALTGPEDWDLPQRIRTKYKIGRIKSFIVHNEGRILLFSLVKKKYYYGLKVSRYIRKHPIKSTAQQVIYLLRPAFYRNWRVLLINPVQTLGMIVMLAVEQIAGFIGFLQGSFKNEKN